MLRKNIVTILLTSIISIGFHCCINANKQSDKKVDTVLEDRVDSVIIEKHQPALSTPTRDDRPKEFSFPFGPDILNTHKFPKKWKTAFSGDKADTIPKNHEKQLDEAIRFTGRKINTYAGEAKKYDLPKAKSIRIYKLDYPYEINDSLIDSIDYYNLKLPKIHDYECFYSYKEIDIFNTKRIIGEYPLESVGILFLYNEKKQELIKIPICASLSTDFSEFNRLFYLTSNELKVFNFLNYFDETEDILDNEFIINIQSTGEVKIKNVAH